MGFLVEQMRLPRYLTPDEAAATAFGLPRMDLQVLWEAISVNLQIPGVGKIPGFEVEMDTKGGYTDQQLKDLVYRIAHIEQSELEKHQASCRQAIIYRDRMLDELAWNEKDSQLPTDMRRQEKRPTSDYVKFFQDEGLPELAEKFGITPNTGPDLPDELPRGLDLTFTAYRKFWVNAQRKDRGTHPKNAEIEKWLTDNGLPVRQSKIIPTIIRPDWAPKGRKE